MASVGHVDDKQFLPFISPPSISTTTSTFSVKQTSPPQASLSKRKSDACVDMQDVLAAAQAAADSAERAAAAARSAASLAQVRINELTMKNNEEVPENGYENPFHADIPNQSGAAEKPHFVPDDDSAGVINSPEPHQVHEYGGGIGTSRMDSPEVEIDSTLQNDHSFQREPVQPQRLTSMDDDYFAYPNLFTSQNSGAGSGVQSSTDNSRSSNEH